MRAILFAAALFSSAVSAQPCTPDDELDKIPGKFVDHKWTPVGGNSFCEGQANTIALKTMEAIEAICKKNFFGDGTIGKGSFGFFGGGYLNEQFLGTYAYNIGFYHLLCIDGKLKTAHEYGTDLDIMINPSYPAGKFIRSSRDAEDNTFDVPGSRKDFRNQIALYRYLIFQNKEEVEKINNGSGYYEGMREKSSVYDEHPDIRRYWFITPPGKQVLIPVSRKAFLKSLLEFYDRELPPQLRRSHKLIKVYKENMAQYKNATTAKEKKLYEDYKNTLEKYIQDSIKYQQGHVIKKNKVNELLGSNSEEWLSQPAIISQAQAAEGYCRSETLEDYLASGCYTFNNFAEGDDGVPIYEWNNAVVKAKNICEPVLIRVSLRYKYNIGFSEKIRDHYTENLDFSALRKLLVSN